MGTFSVHPFAGVIGVLMVFFPVPLAIVYGSLVLLIFVYFRLTKRWIMQEILAEHPSLRPEQIWLVEKTPIFFKYHPGAMLFLGMIVVVRFFSIPGKREIPRLFVNTGCFYLFRLLHGFFLDLRLLSWNP